MAKSSVVGPLRGGLTAAAARVCPHCGVTIAVTPTLSSIGRDPDGDWAIQVANCTNPMCKRLIIELVQGNATPIMLDFVSFDEDSITLHLVHPRTPLRKPLPTEVPEGYGQAVMKAAAILIDSPEASAALTRRCLQQLLVEKAGVTKRDLADQIQQVLDSGELPSHIAIQVDGVRAIGNFGTHPIKSTSTGEIMDVQPGEAAWNIETLEALLDWYFVQAQVRQRKVDELNARMREAGKPEVR